jgi:hypothetical protein
MTRQTSIQRRAACFRSLGWAQALGSAEDIRRPRSWAARFAAQQAKLQDADHA